MVDTILIDSIKRRRKIVGLTQSQAAKIAGMSRQQWYQIETGRRARISWDTINRVSMALQCHPEMLANPQTPKRKEKLAKESRSSSLVDLLIGISGELRNADSYTLKAFAKKLELMYARFKLGIDLGLPVFEDQIPVVEDLELTEFVRRSILGRRIPVSSDEQIRAAFRVQK